MDADVEKVARMLVLHELFDHANVRAALKMCKVLGLEPPECIKTREKA